MGRKLDALLGRKFKTSKFKATINLAVSRLSVLKNQRQARLAVARSDIIQLLNLNHHEHALQRVDQVIKEQNMLDVFVMADGYCHLLLQSINLIEQQKDCPDELKEAASSLIFAAPRCGEFPELQEIRATLTSRYGKEFAYGATELRSNCGVSPRMIQKLSPRQSSLESRMKTLQEIATQNGIVLQLEDTSAVINEGGLVVEQEQNQPKVEAEVGGVSRLENNLTVLLDEVVEVLSFTESRKGKKKFRDAEDAAQVAYESAVYAAEAARAAVELSRSGSFGSDNPDSPNSRPRKVRDSKSEKSKLHTRSEISHESESEHEHKVTNVENEGETSKNHTLAWDTNGSDSDGHKPMVFDESDNEIESEPTGFPSSDKGFDAKQGTYTTPIFDSGRDYGITEGSNGQDYRTHKQFPISSKKAEGNTEPRYDEGLKMQQGVPQLDLTKKPISVRTRRVYGQ